MQLQVVDVDYFYTGTKPVIRIFGKTEKGNSACVLYDKFWPYFYIKPKSESGLLQKLQNTKEIKSAEWVDRLNPSGYHESQMRLLKITLFNPQDVPRVRDTLISEGLAEEAYESDIMFKYRFMADNKIKGMQWIEVSGTRTPASSIKPPGHYATALRPIERIENADLRFMALDIECLATDRSRPMDAKRDPIIMIALSFYPEYREKKSLVLVAKPAGEKDTAGFSDEKSMLEGLLKITDDYDPDIITGYNINGFDMPYLLERMRKLGLPLTLGRCRDKGAFTKNIGMQESKIAVVPGRVVADSYQIVKRDPWVKFHRYNLDTIAKSMLQEQKHDVKFGEMEKLWNGSKDDLRRFIEYARKDAELSLRLITEKGLLNKFYEISKISGLLLQDCLGGQAPRVETMLLHEFFKSGFVMPSKPSKADLIKKTKEREKHELKGATVLEPERGLHAQGCTIVLDFKSLYPSIMRTYNISPDTLLIGDDKPYIESPTGTRFVDASVREGIVPRLLRQLLDARARARTDMKTAQGEARRILNAKQLAFKDLSNSVYGYTGYIRARLYMIDVANSITAFGRENLVKTKKLIEEKFGCKIIYADTDSTFIKTGITDMEEAKKMGEQISSYVTGNLPGFLELQFEKVYKTFLILSKKRYAGWSFVKENNEWKDGIEMKGIETVRRDWCPLVSELMQDVLEIMLKEGDVKKAIEKTRTAIDTLKKGGMPAEKLTIVKGITKSLDSYDGMLPHIELARKMRTRNPQEPPKVGDRIGFVIIRGNQILSKRAEDPEHARVHGLQIDPEYYIQNQIFPPLERIFDCIGVEKSEILGNGKQMSLGDIMNGRQKNPESLQGWEDFVCKGCNKSHRRVPLTGACECGGEILVSYHGSSASKVAMS